MELCRVQKGFE